MACAPVIRFDLGETRGNRKSTSVRILATVTLDGRDYVFSKFIPSSMLFQTRAPRQYLEFVRRMSSFFRMIHNRFGFSYNVPCVQGEDRIVNLYHRTAEGYGNF